MGDRMENINVAPDFKIKVNGQYRDKAGNVWVVLRILPGAQADMKRVDRFRFCMMRYCDIRANMTPA